MSYPFSELPLVFFTTFIPLVGGTFIAIALAVLFGKLNDDQIKTLDRFTFVPLVLLVIGVIGAFFHLTAPQYVVYILVGFGESPMSNEIAVTALLGLLIVAYLVVALLGKASLLFRKIALIVIVAVAFVQAIFMGLAYYINTIVSWANPWQVIQMVGFVLMGCAVGALILHLANATDAGKSVKISAILVISGLAVACISGCIHLYQVSGIEELLVNGADVVAQVIPYGIIALVCGIAGAICCSMAYLKKNKTLFYGLAAGLVLLAIFFARTVFYCVQIGVGL